MFLNNWRGQKPKNRDNRQTHLEVIRLEDRVTPAVYYFNGGNLFGPQNNGFDGNDWRNPFNWGKDIDGTIVVAQGIPGQGDLAVFKGSTEDGKAWQVSSGHKDSNGNYDEFVSTLGRSVKIDSGVTVSVLNVDTTYGGDFFTTNGQGSITATNGRLQSGSFSIPLVNNGAMDFATAPNGQISFSSTVTNRGTINFSTGTVRLSIPQVNGSVPLGNFVNIAGSTLQMSGDARFLAGGMTNDGLVVTSGTNVFQEIDLRSTRTAEYRINSGDLSFAVSTFFPATNTFENGNFIVQPDAVLHFSGSGTRSFKGATTFEGGGLVEISMHGGITLDQAIFSTVGNTRFEVNGGYDDRAGATRFEGFGGLAANSVMTISNGTFSRVSFTNNGTIIIGPSSTNPTPDSNYVYGISDTRFVNNGTLKIDGSRIDINNGSRLINTDSSLIEIVKSTSINGGGVGTFVSSIIPNEDPYGGLIQNEGTIRVLPSADNVTIRVAVDSLDGTIDVQNGYVSIPSNQGPEASGGKTNRAKLFAAFSVNPGTFSISVGGKYLVATGATLDLRGAENLFSPGQVFAGNFQGAGGGKVLLGGENQMRHANWNFTPGMLRWEASDNNTNRIYGDWSNSGELNLVTTETNAALTLLYGTFSNTGIVNIADNTRLELSYYPSNARFINQIEGIVQFGKNITINGAGPGSNLRDIYDPNGAYFENKGRSTFLGNVNFNAIVDNNAGNFETLSKSNVGIGYFRAIHPDLERMSIGGTWIAREVSSFTFYRINNGNSSQIAPQIFRGMAIAEGYLSSIPWLNSITNNFGSISVIDGASLKLGDQSDSATNAFTNSGQLTINGGTIAIPGNFTQASSGKLSAILSETLTELTVGKTASLGGLLTTGATIGFSAADDDRFDIVVANEVIGTFAKQSLNGFVSEVTPMTVTLAPVSQAVDLAVNDVKILTSSGQAIAPGTPISIQFTVRNLSGKSITSGWSDAVFLSVNDKLDSSDTLLSRALNTGGLPAFGSRTVTIPITTPATPGVWSIIVAGDSKVSLLDSNRANNISAAATPLNIAYTELPPGVDVTASFPADDSSYYRLTIAPGTGPVQIVANFAANNPGQLTARFGELPLGAADDYVGNATSNGVGHSAIINLPDASPGVYYIGVKRVASGPVVLRAEVQTLRISGFDNPGLDTTLRANDSLQLVIQGSGFTPASVFKLGSNVGTVTYVNSSTALVTFQVPIATVPLYVSVASETDQFTYRGYSFTVTSTTLNQYQMPNWFVQVSMPSEVRPLREVRATVTFQNNSPFSQPAPLLQLLASNALLRLPSQPYSIGNSMEVLGVKSIGDRYAPGEVGSLEIVVVPDVDQVHQFFDIHATVVAENTFTPRPSPDNPTLVGTGTIGDLPLSSTFIDSLRQTTHAESAWVQTIRPRLIAIIGNTARSYSDALRNAARVLQFDGTDAHDVGRLNSYLVNLADDFGQVESRYKPTAFGRGQNNPYDIHAETDLEGNKLVFFGNSFRPFFRQSVGYQGIAGDRGILSSRPGGMLLTEADGSTYVFRSDGKLDFLTDRAGRKTTFNYTGSRLTSITDFLNDTSTLAYNASGRIISITNAIGVTTTFGYDSTNDLLTSITSPTGTTTFEYADTTGISAFALSSTTGPDGIRTSYNYIDGRLSTIMRAGEAQYSFTYGTNTNLGQVTIVDALGSTTTGLIGEYGQITHSLDATGRVTDTLFDQNDRMTMISSPSGTTRTPIDDNGNISSIIDAAGNRIRVTYDENGVVVDSYRDPAGHLSQYDYSDNYQLSSLTDSQSTTSYSYDSNGNITTTVTNSNRSYTTVFNDKNHPVRRDYGDGTFTTFEYDSHRNLIKVIDYGPDGTNPKPVSMAYDSADRLTSITYPNGSSVSYGYDSAGRINRIIPSNSAAIDYAYDSFGRLSTVSRAGTVKVTYGYDAKSRLTSKTFDNATRSITTYDTLDRITRIDLQAPDSSILNFQAYAYNTRDQIISISSSDGVTTYGYDLLGQLTTVTSPNGRVETISYDAAGNRIGYSANASNEYTTTPDGGTFTYDADGNLIARSGENGEQAQTQYVYDARGRLITTSGPHGVFQYEYDALGNRSAVIENGIRKELLIDVSGLGNVLNESVNGAVTVSYLLGAGLEAQFDSTGMGSYYHANLQGSVDTITDAAGAVTATYRYSPFGAIVSQSGIAAASNVYRYNGVLGVADRGDGLLDMRNRFYDASLGRFTQRDPIGIAGQDTNDYRFVKNNPISHADPSGLMQSELWFTTRYVSRTLGVGAVQTLQRSLIANGTRAALQNVLPSLGSFASSTITPNVFKMPALYDSAFAASQIAKAETAVAAEGTATAEAAVVAQAGIGTETVVTAEVAAAATAGEFLAALTIPVTTTATLIAAFDLLGNKGRSFESYYARNTNTALKPAGYSERLRTNALNDPRIKSDLDIIRRNDPNFEPSDEFLIQKINSYRDFDQANLARARSEIRTPNDPNDIVGPKGFGPQGFIYPAGEFGYTIRFQNKPEATAPAQVVSITQQIDSDLDWESFQLQSFGWAGSQFDIPPGLQSYHTRISDLSRNAIVDIEVDFNAFTGYLTWTLTTLDPITLDQPVDSVTAGFLPPDDATGRGQGFVSYSVRPRSNSPTGTRYDAQATIVFDTESPINTPAIYNTADRGEPRATVNALPEQTRSSSVLVDWAGQDDTGGSGVASYNVYSSIDGGPWSLWLRDTSLTSSVFSGAIGQTLAFYAVNSDNVGLRSTTPRFAQALTTLAIDGHSNSPPITDDDATSTQIDTTTIINVLANDTDPNGDRLTVIGASSPLHGSVVINPDQTLTYTPIAGFSGVDRFTYTISDGNGGTSTAVVSVSVISNLIPTPSSLPVGSQQFAVGAGPGTARVTMFNNDGSVRYSLTPFGDISGGIRIAVADFNADGIPDLVVGTGPGIPTQVHILDGVTQGELFAIDPFERSFTGGVFVAAGDINRDGIPELVITPDEGGGARVRIFNGADFTQIADFYGIDDPSFRGGARASIGDLNGDGYGDLIVGAGSGGGPRLAGYDGKYLSRDGGPKLFADFFVFEESVRNGVFVAVGDINGDGYADVISGGGPGSGPRIFVLDGQDLLSNQQVSLANFLADDVNNRDGISVAVKNLDGDNYADLIVGSISNSGPRVTGYLGKDLNPNGTPDHTLNLDVFDDIDGGIFVG